MTEEIARATALLEGTDDETKSKAHKRLLLPHPGLTTDRRPGLPPGPAATQGRAPRSRPRPAGRGPSHN
jgi:hypothetical protein